MWRRKPERGMDLQRHPYPPRKAPVLRGRLGQRIALAWPERTEAKKRWRESLRRGTRDLALSSLLALEVFFLPGFVFLPLSPYHLPRVGVQRKNHQAKPLPTPRPTSTSPHCKTYSEASEIILDPAKWSPSYPLTAKSARRPPQLVAILSTRTKMGCHKPAQTLGWTSAASQPCLLGSASPRVAFS